MGTHTLIDVDKKGRAQRIEYGSHRNLRIASEKARVDAQKDPTQHVLQKVFLSEHRWIGTLSPAIQPLDELHARRRPCALGS
jgi:hypothetical protein